MNKEYYNEKKANYINKMLQSTKIDKIFYPIIVDIILRRQYQFRLDDDYFKRDVNSFISNVKRITIEKLEDNTGGQYMIKSEKIVINSSLFRNNTIDYEILYEQLVHECCHAMNYEMQENGEKDDRTFARNNSLNLEMGIMEIFTECEADFLVHNYNAEQDNLMICTETIGYPDITGYFDILTACFGVNKNELLKSAIMGKSELNTLLNRSLNQNNNELDNNNELFEKIAFNIGLILSVIYQEDYAGENDKFYKRNLKDANKRIYTFAHEAINKRILNIRANTIEEYKEQYEIILRDESIIRQFIENSFELYETNKDVKKLRNSTNGKFKIVDLKLRCIDEILSNSAIEDKLSLLKKIQACTNLFKIKEFIKENGIEIDANKKINIPTKKIEEHNKDYTSNRMEWDNTQIFGYMEKNKKHIANPRHNRIEIIKSGLKKVDRNVRLWMLNRLIKIQEKRESKRIIAGGCLLPEGKGDISSYEPISNEPESKIPPWDLSNWGMNKQDLKYDSNTIDDDTNNKIGENDFENYDDRGWEDDWIQ